MKAVCVLVDGCVGVDMAEALQMARVRLAGEEECIEGTLTEIEARQFGSLGLSNLKSKVGESMTDWKNRALVNRDCKPGVALYDVVQPYEIDDFTLFSESYIFAGWVKENGQHR